MAFQHKHLIDIREYSSEDIQTILHTADKFRAVNERRIKKSACIAWIYGCKYV